MTAMVRKQVYIEPRQDRLLKEWVNETGMSEAEIIRQAIDGWLQDEMQRRQAAEAWDKAYQFMLELRERGAVAGPGRTWTREGLYEERLSRYDRHSG